MHTQRPPHPPNRTFMSPVPISAGNNVNKPERHFPSPLCSGQAAPRRELILEPHLFSPFPLFCFPPFFIYLLRHSLLPPFSSLLCILVYLPSLLSLFPFIYPFSLTEGKYTAIYYNLYCNTLENISQYITNTLIYLKIYSNILLNNILLYIDPYILKYMAGKTKLYSTIQSVFLDVFSSASTFCTTLDIYSTL